MWITVSSRRYYGLRIRQQGVAADMRTAQIWMAAFRPGTTPDPSAPAFWLPIQSLTTGNHIAQWTQRVVRHRCASSSECSGADHCLQGICYGG